MKLTKFPIPYWYFLLLPTLLYYLGVFLNVGVMALNHGQMPVLMPPGLGNHNFDFDATHVLMTNQTHLKFFCDWIWTGDGIASPGDALLWFGDKYTNMCLAVWAALMVRDTFKNETGSILCKARPNRTK